ncbi:unnamed protein product, partial [Mesorhabditis belari]|uniref:Saposin B-type domain-containing protein n=1 Tax=Mesorhabditis belari TaxID=2138241 RepID=A0AAF3FMF9_9BILA
MFSLIPVTICLLGWVSAQTITPSLQTITPSLQTIAPTSGADSCLMCEFVVMQAESHYHRKDSKKDVQKELLDDCKSLKRFYGDASVEYCKGWVYENIDVLYSDIQAGKPADQICQELGQCGGTAEATWIHFKNKEKLITV